MTTFRKTSLSLMIAAAMIGCGDGKKNGEPDLLPEPGDEQPVTVGGASFSATHAALLDGLLTLGDDVAEDVLAELAIVDPDSIAADLSAAPGLALGILAADPREALSDPTVEIGAIHTRTVTQETYAGGRVSRIEIERQFGHGGRDVQTLTLEFTYSSTDTQAGDLNDQATVGAGGPPAYVYMSINGNLEFAAIDDAAVAASSLEGFRHWFSDPATAYLAFHSELAQDEAAPGAITKVVWSGEFNTVTTGAGSFARDVYYADGESDLYAWDISLDVGDADVLNLALTRSAPNGVTSVGTGSIDRNGTLGCNLDDIAAIAVTRTFPSAGSESAESVVESLSYSQNGAEISVNGEISQADEAPMTRSLTLTRTAPASCGDVASGETFDVSVESYSGETAELAMLRQDGVSVIAGEFASGESTTTSLRALIVYGSSDVEVVERDGDATVISVLNLVADPSGRAAGSFTGFDADDNAVSVQVSRDQVGTVTVELPEANDAGETEVDFVRNAE